MTQAISFHPHIVAVRPAPRTSGISTCIHSRHNLVVGLAGGLGVGVAGVALELSSCKSRMVSRMVRVEMFHRVSFEVYVFANGAEAFRWFMHVCARWTHCWTERSGES